MLLRHAILICAFIAMSASQDGEVDTAEDAAAYTLGYSYVKIIKTSHPYRSEVYYVKHVQVGIFGAKARYLCADHIDAADAIVLCRKKGFNNFNFLNPPVFQGIMDWPLSSSKTWGYSFACNGNEKKLGRCGKVRARSCPSGRMALVDCKPTDIANKQLKTSLVGSYLKHQGIVKLDSTNYPSITGKICLESGTWSENEAKAVCRSMGYDLNGKVKAIPISKDVLNMFPSSNPGLRYIMKDVKCKGTETTMADCKHTDMCTLMPDQSFNCAQTCNGDDVGVMCVTDSTVIPCLD